MKAILVLGASGFVGTTLIPLLSERAERLILIDCVPVAPAVVEEAKRQGTHADIILNKRLKELSVDPVDAVICLAGATSVDAALEEPEVAIEQNLSIAIDFAEWLRNQDPSIRAVYLSSDEVLGASCTPLTTQAPLAPTQPYAASKAAAEIVLHTYRDVYHINLVTLRSCNLVGGNQRKPKLIPVVADCLVRNEAVPIHGDGSQLREWMAVEDLCSAIQLLLHTGMPGIYQAASGVHLAVTEVMDIVAGILGKTPKVEHVPDRLVQDRNYAMDPSGLHALGWRCATDPVEAIRKASLALATQIRKQGLG